MSGTIWPTFTPRTRGKASEVDARFEWLEGDIVPMKDGTKYDGIYDLGEINFKWKDLYLSGQVLTSQGTATLPSISNANSPHDGFYFPAAGALALAFNSEERFRFTQEDGILFSLSTTTYHMGIDSSDSTFKIGYGSDVQTNASIKISSTNIPHFPNQTAVKVRSGTVAATGNGTEVTITAWSNVDINVGSALNASTGIFTAPEDGNYLFIMNALYVTSGSTTMSSFSIKLYASGSESTEEKVDFSPLSNDVFFFSIENLTASEPVALTFTGSGIGTPAVSVTPRMLRIIKIS